MQVLQARYIPSKRRTNVEDVGPTMYKCYSNVLCLLGRNLPIILLYYATMGVVSHAVVRAASVESWRSRVRPPLWPSSFTETKCFYPAHSQ